MALKFVPEDQQAGVLEGATVVHVAATQSTDEICVVEKAGKRYRLCATELGWWLEEI